MGGSSRSIAPCERIKDHIVLVGQEINKEFGKLLLHPSGMNRQSVAPTIFLVVVDRSGVRNWQDFEQRRAFIAISWDQYVWGYAPPRYSPKMI